MPSSVLPTGPTTPSPPGGAPTAGGGGAAAPQLDVATLRARLADEVRLRADAEAALADEARRRADAEAALEAALRRTRRGCTGCLVS